MCTEQQNRRSHHFVFKTVSILAVFFILCAGLALNANPPDVPTFNIVRPSTTGVPGNEVRVMAFDPSGNLWIAARDIFWQEWAVAMLPASELAYHPLPGGGFDTGAWKVWSTVHGNPLPSQFIYDMEFSSDGTMWLASDGGLTRFRPNAEPADRWFTYTPSNSPLVMTEVRSIAIDSQNNLWVANARLNYAFSQLFKLDTVTSQWTSINTGQQPWEVAVGYNDHIIISMINAGGVTEFDGASWVVHAANPREMGSIMQDAQGNIWAAPGVNGEGLWRWNGSSWFNWPTVGGTITVTGIGKDRDGVVYISTWYGGLYKMIFDTPVFFANADNIPRSVIGRPDGDIWINNYGGNGTVGTVRHYTSSGQLLTRMQIFNSGLQDHFVDHIRSDSLGNMWFATGEGGLSRMLGSDGAPLAATHWRNWGAHNDQAEPYPWQANEPMYSVYEDTGGIFWMGGNGVGRWDSASGQFTNFWNWQNSNLDTSGINAIIKRQGTIWVGSGGSSVCWLNGNNWTRVVFSPTNYDANYVNAMAVDTANNLWVASNYALRKFAPGDNTNFTEYNTSNSGLPSNYIVDVVADPAGGIWVGTTAGLVRYDGTTWTVYNQANTGMPGTTVAGIARRASDGLIAIASNQGGTWPYTGGVSTFNGGTWTHYTPDNSPLPHWQVVAVEFDANGNLWASPMSTGVVQIMISGIVVTTPTPTPLPTPSPGVSPTPTPVPTPSPTATPFSGFFESFDDVGPTHSPTSGPQNLIDRGWIFRNQSSPLGEESWIQNYEGYYWPPPQSGTGYMAVRSTSTDFFGGTVSNWAILPAVPGQNAGDELRFYLNDVYGTGGSNISTVQVRYSPTGGTSTGSTATSVGDFTELLVDINPVLTGWNLHSVTLPGNGRIALRYFIADACNFACFSSYTGIDSLSVGGAPPPACNLPPVPAAGQTVTWTVAGSPYTICENIGIPANSTVNIQPGVVLNFNADKQVVVSGTMRVQGQAGQPVVFNASAVYPPIVDVNGGTLDALFAEFHGQLRVENASTVTLTNNHFVGSQGLLWVQELPTGTRPYLRIENSTFDSSSATISDAITVMRNNVFNNSTCWLLRGYADVTATNTFNGGGLTVTREESLQPFYLDGVHATNSVAGGMSLAGGNFLSGPNTVLQNNLYPLSLEGGLLPGSTIPLSGNSNNAIDVGTGGFAGRGRWSQLGLPYRLTQASTSFPGGHLAIDPGTTIEAADPNASLLFRSTRQGILKGLPDAPIVFQGFGGQPWSGLAFVTNSSTGPRLEYCTVRNANFGVISSDNGLYVDNCLITNNTIGANANSYGTIHFAKTRFVGNGTGVNLTALGGGFLSNASMPNSFEGNGAGIDTASGGDARNSWWNHPSGPTVPGNPGGQGDPIIGSGASSVQFSPFLTSAPNFANRPPVVRDIEPGLTQLYNSPDVQIPDFLLDQGTKYIVRWNAQDDDTIVSQRIEFSPDGHYPDRYYTLVNNIPGSARSWEITVPDPGYAVTNQPQFLRVVATDASGQQGWDEVPVLVPSGRLTGNLTITTDLSGQTFTAGDPIPDMDWTGSLPNFPTITPVVVLESDGAAISGIATGGHGQFFQNFPMVSTDRARLAIQARNNSNDVIWFFAPGYFSIRHDPRLGFQTPAASITFPMGGESFPGGSTVPVSWTASAPMGLRSFDIQGSYDNGRTWHLIARDLPGATRSYTWQLPPSTGIANVRVRIIARDVRFQNRSATSGPFSITGQTGTPTPTPASTPTPTPTPALTPMPTPTPTPFSNLRTSCDYDGDGRADVSVFRASQGTWYLQRSRDGFTGISWGISTDKIMPADYDGDGRTDTAVFRPSEGNWYVLQSSTGTLMASNFGLGDDMPIPADFDGDQRADIAVFRPSSGTWWISRSTGGIISAQFGTSTDRPLVGDWNGDGRADLGVFRPANGTWYTSTDLIDPSHNFTAVPFGVSTDLVTPADLDGDDRTDIAVFRPSNGAWYWLNSSNGAFNATQFGITEDIPATGDFDGDGRADISVFRPSGGIWYRLNSSNGAFLAVQFGMSGDLPTPAAFRY